MTDSNRATIARVVAIIASSSSLTMHSGAQAAEPEESLSEVIVSATRSPTSLARVPESVSVLSENLIEQTPAGSLDDVLRSVPSINLLGVSSYSVHPTANFVSMRGLGYGARSLVLLDGVPLNDSFFGSVQWSLVPLDAVQRVEVIRGGGATLWGNYAMGGVINVVTHVPESRELRFTAGGGSYGTYRANAYMASPISDRVRVGLNLGAKGTDGFQGVDPAHRNPIHVPTSSRARNVQLTTQFELTDSLSGDFRAAYRDYEQTFISAKSQNDQRQWNFAGSLAKTFGNASITGTVFRTDSDFHTDNTNAVPGVPFGTAEFVQNRHTTPVESNGASLLWALTDDSWLRLVSVGLDYQQVRGSNTAEILDVQEALVRTDIGKGAQQFAGVFAQVHVFPTDALEILASARYQYYENYDGFDGTPGGSGMVPDADTTSFDPRISVRYSLSPLFALRAAVYKAFHAPSLDTLYRSTSVPEGIFRSNVALTPEKLKGGEVGFDFTPSGVRAQVTYYYNIVDDLLTARNLEDAELPPGFFFGSLNINAGKLRATGVESEVDWVISDSLRATASYTYSESVIRENPLDPTTIGRQVSYVPRNSASASLSYEGAQGLGVATRLRWADRMYGDNVHTLPIDSYFVVDLSLSYALTRNFEPFIEIENLFDRKYIGDNSGFAPPQLGTPFTVFVGVRAQF